VNTGAFGIAAHLIEKHRLAYSTQTYEHHAFSGTAQAEALQSNSNVFSDLASTCEFRRRAAGTGSVWIANRVHGYSKFSKVMTAE